MSRKIYIHTIEHAPAFYEGEKQIVYADRKNGVPTIPNPALSLEQVEKEQELSFEWRKQRGIFTMPEYGYIEINIDDTHE